MGESGALFGLNRVVLVAAIAGILALPAAGMAQQPGPPAGAQQTGPHAGRGGPQQTVAPAPTLQPTACVDAAVLAVDPATRARAIDALYCLINEFRAANGRAPVRRSGKLARAATRQSDEMQRLNYVSHTNHEGLGVRARVAAAGYRAKGKRFSIGEALGWGEGDAATAQGVLDLLENSPPHRRRLLDASYMNIGVGLAIGIPVASDAQGTTIAVILGHH